MQFTAMNDKAILIEIGDRINRQRLNRNITQAALASHAGVARTVVQRIEGGQGCTLENLIRILRALGLLDQMDAFLPVPEISPLQLVKLHGRKRQRATTQKGL